MTVYYTITRWPLRPHFWVTLLVGKAALPAGVPRMKECNTLDEAKVFVREVRKKMPKGVSLKMLRQDTKA